MHAANPPFHARLRRAAWIDRPGAWLTLGLALLSLDVLRAAVVDILAGGHPWKQGDWLVNSELIETRRGAFGSALLRISDALGVSPVVVAGATQIAIASALFAATLALAWRMRGTRAIWALFLSPAFFVLFWWHDAQGSMRKEMFAFTALALLALRAGGMGRRFCVPGAFALMAVGILAHEANMLFLPAFFVCLFAGLGRETLRPAPMLGGLGLCALAVAAVVYAYVHASAADWAAICAPLLDRGVDPRICEGAIAFLRHDAETMRAFIRSHATWQAVAAQALTTVAAAAPLAWLAAQTDRRGALWAGLAGSLALMAPLCLIALDWGRFLDFAIASWGLTFYALTLSGRVRVVREITLRRLAPLLAAGLLWAPSHVIGLE